MSDSEAKLLRERKTVKASLTRIRTYVTNFTSEDDIEELSERNEKIEELWSKYDQIQQQLEIIDGDKHEEDRGAFEASYYQTKSLLKQAIKSSDIANETTVSDHNRSSTHSLNSEQTPSRPKVKLPQLTIPQFSGNCMEWRNFQDIFTAVIHDNESISNIEKLFYLKSAVKGEAQQVIESIAASADNYGIAYQLLFDRYNNEQFIIDAHIKALFEIPAVTKENVIGLRRLITDTKQHLRSLEALNLPTSEWDAVVIYMVAQKLDNASRREWELTKNREERPTLDDLCKFIEQRCFALEAVSSTSRQSTDKHKPRSVLMSAEATSEEKQHCKLCKKRHDLATCDQFLKQTANEKIQTIKTIGVCFNCLKDGHGVSQCRSGKCRKCNKKHHTLIHLEKASQPSEPRETAETQQSDQQPLTSNPNINSLHNKQENKQILLSTAVVLIMDNNGKWKEGRALLDSASQSNFITSRLSNSLMNKCYRANIPIHGVSQLQTNIKWATNCEIKSRINNFAVKLDFLLLDNITSQLPTNFINKSNWLIPEIPLVDPEFNKPSEIDLLIGAECYLELMKRGQIKLGKGMPILQNSQLGWIVAGRLRQPTRDDRHSSMCFLTTTEQINAQLRKFWEIEEISERKHFSSQEAKCEEHFCANTKRTETGRFIVKLPFQNNPPDLGESYNTAFRRFLYTEQRFNKNAKLKLQYTQFMQEYKDLNHMELLSNEEAYMQQSEGYYLPHHAVTKETSLTTKIRVVFDGSAKTSNGSSLNDTLLIGPTIQDDLFSIVTRFRKHKIVLTADIEKMYRQILINEEDLQYQKILWRENPSEPLQTFKLKTITYGTSPAPFLAIRCLHQLAKCEKSEYPIAAEILQSDFYVDDVLTGADTLEEAQIIQEQLINILERGGMKLRKWSSNHELMLSNLPVSNDPLLLLDPSQTARTLGLEWNARQDTITYTLIVRTEEMSITKRQILSQIARLFDPLGLLGPIIVKAKLIMQELWQLRADWDEPVPPAISSSWCEFTNKLGSINNLSIPRRITNDEPLDIELHAFCDASERAYGACIYVRSTNKENKHLVRLVCSKSKVAPLKTLSLPRLELCAAVLLSKLYKSTIKALRINFHKSYFWSDSTITLYWINTPPNLLKTFVANRVSEIQEITETTQWKHIRSYDNPADIISRGLSPNEIHSSQLWWHGPSWMTSDEDVWPEDTEIARNLPYDQAELKPNTVTTLVAVQQIDLFERCSTLSKLQRTMSYCLRFIHNSKKRATESRNTGALTVVELQHALEVLIKLAQEDHFSQEMQDIRANKQVSLRSHLKQLYPFVDANSLLRVGGRLQNSNVSYGQRHPIILPAKHQLTKLLYQNAHICLLHAGTQAVLSHIRHRYWPINARAGIKQVIHNCLPCFKLKKSQQSQLMGMLPSPRVTIARPFLNVGLDYGGPIPIRVTRRTSSKAYIALFVCMATKAIHLELVSSLATSEFMAALKRFIARRGKCANIYSDNGTNFHGANNELQEMRQYLQQHSIQEEISNAAAKEGIQWHFIPPGAPHFGGLWEAGIKTVKHHLKRVIGESVLTFEELYTLLTQIEACTNSRPLIPMSDDPSDLTCLTPSHFLIGDILTMVPEADLTDTLTNRLTRWQLVQQKMQHFWHGWSNEYLNQLQQRTKWSRNEPNLTVGTLVLIKEENISPLRWKLARVEQLHPGKDNQVRVVTVKTSTGSYKRPVTKICVLPHEETLKPEF